MTKYESKMVRFGDMQGPYHVALRRFITIAVIGVGVLLFEVFGSMRETPLYAIGFLLLAYSGVAICYTMLMMLEWQIDIEVEE